jgi:hypothetical protein
MRDIRVFVLFIHVIQFFSVFHYSIIALPPCNIFFALFIYEMQSHPQSQPQSQPQSWLQSIWSGLKTRFSNTQTKDTPPVDGRPTPRQLQMNARRKSGISKRRQVYSVHNPSLIELNQRFNEYRQKNPYGVCRVCNKNTHITEDHDAVVKLARQKAQSKRKRTIAAVGMKKARGHNWTIKRRPLPKRKPIEISPFICLDEHMQLRYQFNNEEFEQAWTTMTDLINSSYSPDLFRAVSQAGQYIMEEDGTTYRTFRDDWPGCCPDKVKQIAREMAQKFLENGIITRDVLYYQSKLYLYYNVCYAAIHLYLVHAEWEEVYLEVTDVEIGKRLVSAIVSNERICDRMQLGEYSARLMDVVRNEGADEHDHE